MVQSWQENWLEIQGIGTCSFKIFLKITLKNVLVIYWPTAQNVGSYFRPEIEPILCAVDAQSFNHWTNGSPGFFFNQRQFNMNFVVIQSMSL